MNKVGKYTAKWKASTDQKQDSLRSNKAHWNAKVSEFIDNFLEFKKLLNGRPNIFNNKIAPLTRPIPSDPRSIIGVLSLDFQEINRDAVSIIAQQKNYSDTRAKKVAEILLCHQYYLYSGAAYDDPAYDNLIDFKKQWNVKSKEFIKSLINFIWLINGKSSTYNMERSLIIDPIPGNPNEAIASLLTSFNEIYRDALSILDRQNGLYLAKKTKKSSMTNNKMVKVSQDQLNINASNVFTRLYSKITNPSFGSDSEARITRYRMSWLSKLSEISDKLDEFQSHVVGSTYNSVAKAIIVFNLIESNWKFYIGSLKNFSLSEEEVQEKEKPSDLDVEIKPSQRKDKKSKDQTPKEEGIDIDLTELSDLDDVNIDLSEKPETQVTSTKPTDTPSSDISTPDEDQQTSSRRGRKRPTSIDTSTPDKPLPKPSTPPTPIDISSISIDFDTYDTKEKDGRINLVSEIESKLALVKLFSKRNPSFHTHISNIENLIKQINVSLPLDKINPIQKVLLTANFKSLISGWKLLIEECEKYNATLIANANYEAIAQIEKQAGYYLSRLVGRTRHKAWTDETSALRLDCYEGTSDSQKLLDSLMDHLESGFDFDFISKTSKEISDLIRNVRYNLHLLGKISLKYTDNKDIQDFVNRGDFGFTGDEKFLKRILDKAKEQEAKQNLLPTTESKENIIPNKREDIES